VCNVQATGHLGFTGAFGRRLLKRSRSVLLAVLGVGGAMC
jgi:hypothetical protein